MLSGARRTHRVFDAQRCRPERYMDETHHQQQQQLLQDATLMLDVGILYMYSSINFFDSLYGQQNFEILRCEITTNKLTNKHK